MSEFSIANAAYAEHPLDDPRRLRGLELAATKRIVNKAGSWIVPSATMHGEKYTVVNETCTCPDHQLRQVRCKHVWAVEFVRHRETAADGSTTETESVTIKRVTYSQNWSAYNRAQTEEKTRFTALLAELCAEVEQPEQTKGRPRLPMGDMVFASAYKVFTGFSSRRFTSDLRDAQAGGYITSAPHFNSVSNYLADERLTPILQGMIETSSLPLRAIETNFAVDSSGFGTSRFIRWYDKKYGRNLDVHEWVKVHLMCGVKTNIVTSAEVSGWSSNDSPYLVPLLNATAKNFRINDVTGDKAYNSRNNATAIERVGGTPFIPFRSNVVEPSGESAWSRMYHYMAYNRGEFLDHYHKRSNVETVFSMIKAKFGDGVRSKTDVSMTNEVLAKVLCHNICCVIGAIHELGIPSSFCAGSVPAQEVLPFRA